ncbi:MAG: hypothetical protein H3C54_04010 [Taibaiella sp.]|nr:hypothetical protein [Taibaiella sp.]
MNKILSIVLIFLATVATAQEKSPLIKGEVFVDLAQGTIDADLTIDEMPFVKDYLILLNAGMNVRYVRHLKKGYTYYCERGYDSKISYEAFNYYIPDNTGKGKYIPQQGLRWNYTGKFPVVNDTNEAQRVDWRGNIAFNDYSLRTDGAQAAWYPVLYDVTTDKSYTRVRYDIKVNCKGCSSMFINGSKPVPGSIARFKNEDPCEMFMYLGRYNVKNVDGTYFLKPDADDEKLRSFGEMTNKLKKFYTDKTGIAYERSIVYANSTPVSKNNAWMFVAYPTIAMVGWGEHGLSGVLDDTTMWSYNFIAHELAHFCLEFNSPIGDALNEGFAEYMSSLAIKQLFGEQVYKKSIEEWITNTKDFKPVCLSKITDEQGYGSRQRYVYNYMPLLLTAIGREIGTDAMWRFVKKLSDTGKVSVPTDYTYFIRCLAEVVQDKPKMDQIRTHYLEGDNTLSNAIEAINK